jgi:hypothetical protein
MKSSPVWMAYFIWLKIQNVYFWNLYEALKNAFQLILNWLFHMMTHPSRHVCAKSICPSNIFHNPNLTIILGISGNWWVTFHDSLVMTKTKSSSNQKPILLHAGFMCKKMWYGILFSLSHNDSDLETILSLLGIWAWRSKSFCRFLAEYKVLRRNHEDFRSL